MGSNGTSPKVIIITAIISAITAIAVALIGIAPALHDRESQKSVQQEECTISGKIISAGGDPLKNAEIYLIRATGSDRMATTDDKGKFTFSKIPDAAYWVVVRNVVSGKASRVLISKDDSAGEIEVVHSLLHYVRSQKK